MGEIMDTTAKASRVFPKLNPFHSRALIRSAEQPTQVIEEVITLLIPKRFSRTSAV